MKNIRWLSLVVLAALLIGCVGNGSNGKGTYAASGRIMDVNGKGVKGITVAFSGGTTGFTTTDGEGTWQASLEGTVKVEPQGHQFDPPYKTVIASSPKADFVMLEDEYVVLDEKEVVVEDEDLVLDSDIYAQAPRVEVKKGVLARGTRISYEVMEDIPTFEVDSPLAISGFPVRLQVFAGSGRPLSNNPNGKFAISGQYSGDGNIECIGIFTGEVWIAYQPELRNGYWEVEIDLDYVNPQADGSVSIEIARFDDVFEKPYQPQGLFDPVIDLYKWSRCSNRWETTDAKSIKEEIRSVGGANTFFLVHGIISSYKSMTDLADYLANYEELLIYAIDYGYIRGIEVQGRGVARFLEQCVPTNEKVNIIAHSMGGLVTRSAIELEGAKTYVQKVLTLGTPHLGVPATIVSDLELNLSDNRVRIPMFVTPIVAHVSTQLRDLKEKSAFIGKLDIDKPENIYYAFLAGNSNRDYWATPITTNAYPFSDNDGMVAVYSALRYHEDSSKAPDYDQIFPLHHEGLRRDSSVFAEIDQLFGLSEQGPCEFAGGSGTCNDPFLVANARQLDSVRYYPFSHFKQIAHIDLESYSSGKG